MRPLSLVGLIVALGCATAKTPAPPEPAAADSVGIGEDPPDRCSSSEYCKKPVPRTCSIRAGEPDPKCTPGAVMTTDLEIICHTSTKCRRCVSRAMREAVFREYGISPADSSEYEIDHLIPLELGGSNDQDNLWPQAAFPFPGFRDKDHLESQLHYLVCHGRESLEVAQREIVTAWKRLCLKPVIME
jgi:hypothetical protein